EPGEAGDGVRVLAGGVGDRHAVVGRHLDTGGGRRGAVDARVHPVAVLVLQSGHGELLLDGVGELDVAGRARGALYEPGGAVVALAAETHRPVHAGPRADLALELRRDLGEVVGEDRVGARAVRAASDDDALLGQLHARVVGDDRRVVPLGDLPEEDVGERLAGEAEVLHAGRVVG